MEAQNAIYLDKEMGGKGRQFKSRFLVPGLVKYDYGVCLLTKENADKFIQGFIGCPVVINHQDVTDDNAKDVSVGNIFSVWFDEKDGYYWCNGIITDKHAIELIDKGYSVSCQYTITEYSDNVSGALHNGNPYDKIIENGKPEHLAIVDNPRYEGAIIAVNSTNGKLKVESGKLDYIDQFKDTLYTALAEGIVNRLGELIASNEDKWITIKPNGEENKGKHLLIKDGESVEDAMHRNGWYKKRQAKDEKAQKEWEETLKKRDEVDYALIKRAASKKYGKQYNIQEIKMLVGAMRKGNTYKNGLHKRAEKFFEEIAEPDDRITEGDSISTIPHATEFYNPGATDEEIVNQAIKQLLYDREKPYTIDDEMSDFYSTIESDFKKSYTRLNKSKSLDILEKNFENDFAKLETYEKYVSEDEYTKYLQHYLKRRKELGAENTMDEKTQRKKTIPERIREFEDEHNMTLEERKEFRIGFLRFMEERIKERYKEKLRKKYQNDTKHLT